MAFIMRASTLDGFEKSSREAAFFSEELGVRSGGGGAQNLEAPHILKVIILLH